MNSEISIPKWYADLREWREEHKATGALWDIYSLAVQERVKYTFYSGLLLGFLVGFLVGKFIG